MKLNPTLLGQDTVAGILHDGGIPCLEWPGRTARAAGHAVRRSTVAYEQDGPVVDRLKTVIVVRAAVGQDGPATDESRQRHGDLATLLGGRPIA